MNKTNLKSDICPQLVKETEEALELLEWWIDEHINIGNSPLRGITYFRYYHSLLNSTTYRNSIDNQLLKRIRSEINSLKQNQFRSKRRINPALEFGFPCYLLTINLPHYNLSTLPRKDKIQSAQNQIQDLLKDHSCYIAPELALVYETGTRAPQAKLHWHILIAKYHLDEHWKLKNSSFKITPKIEKKIKSIFKTTLRKEPELHITKRRNEGKNPLYREIEEYIYLDAHNEINQTYTRQGTGTFKKNTPRKLLQKSINYPSKPPFNYYDMFYLENEITAHHGGYVVNERKVMNWWKDKKPLINNTTTLTRYNYTEPDKHLLITGKEFQIFHRFLTILPRVRRTGIFQKDTQTTYIHKNNLSLVGGDKITEQLYDLNIDIIGKDIRQKDIENAARSR